MSEDNVLNDDSGSNNNRNGRISFKRKATDDMKKYLVTNGDSGSSNGNSDDDDDDGGQKPSKMSKYENKAVMKMMASMGYKKGQGLGKHEQGISQPIEASKQKGKQGLGHQSNKKGLKPSLVVWNFESEELGVCEKINWLSNPSIIAKIAPNWLECGPVKLTIDDEVEFCSEEVLKNVIDGKTIFDSVDPEDMRKARTRSNPYELIKGAFFINRAAMKMANMDAVFGYMFTSPKLQDGTPLVNENFELLTFADICAGPGGFSEYVLWRKEGRCKGFGFTLKGENDFKLEDFNAGPAEMFEPHYGIKAQEGDGDIFDPENQRAFEEFVKRRTKNRGVHVVMADGGFSVDGQENIQEILSHRLYLCQFLVALSILRAGGNFVCKLFDLFTAFSVGLIFLMSHCFRRINIFKPVTSRPANSERYLICENFIQSDLSTHILDYYRQINERMGSSYLGTKSSDWMIRSIVPCDLLKCTGAFYEYIKTSNDFLGDMQKVSLFKIKIFVQNVNLTDTRQRQVRVDCLEKWNVPDQVKAKNKDNNSEGSDVPRVDPTQRFYQLAKRQFLHKPTNLTTLSMNDIKCLRVVMATVAATKNRCLLMSVERNTTYIQGEHQKWEKLEMLTSLPRNTILDVEVVEEQRGELQNKGRKKVAVIHVFDLIMWFGKDMTHLNFDERQQQLRLLISASTRITQTNIMPLHVKRYHALANVNQEIFDQLQYTLVKGWHIPKLTLPISNFDEDLVDCGAVDNNHKRHNRYIIPHGLHLVVTCPLPWIIGYSNSRKKLYYYHTVNRASSFERPEDVKSTYEATLKNSYYWTWGEDVKMVERQVLDQGQSSQGFVPVTKEEFLQFVEKLRNF